MSVFSRILRNRQISVGKTHKVGTARCRVDAHGHVRCDFGTDRNPTDAVADGLPEGICLDLDTRTWICPGFPAHGKRADLRKSYVDETGQAWALVGNDNLTVPVCVGQVNQVGTEIAMPQPGEITDCCFDPASSTLSSTTHRDWHGLSVGVTNYFVYGEGPFAGRPGVVVAGQGLPAQGIIVPVLPKGVRTSTDIPRDPGGRVAIPPPPPQDPGGQVRIPPPPPQDPSGWFRTPPPGPGPGVAQLPVQHGIAQLPVPRPGVAQLPVPRPGVAQLPVPQPGISQLPVPQPGISQIPVPGPGRIPIPTPDPGRVPIPTPPGRVPMPTPAPTPAPTPPGWTPPAECIGQGPVAAALCRCGRCVGACSCQDEYSTGMPEPPAQEEQEPVGAGPPMSMRMNRRMRNHMLWYGRR